MAPAISIRNASPADFDAIFRFVCELQDKKFDKIILANVYEVNLKNSDNIYLIAEQEFAPIGYASCHLQFLLHHGGKVAEIQEMYVQSEYRSSGAGRLLMEAIKKLAKEKGAIQLEVTTRKIRERAIQFYKREAFDDSHQKLVYYFS